ncbi:hypothetical protein EVG20_g11577, partial [Dentipellis fragilis]
SRRNRTGAGSLSAAPRAPTTHHQEAIDPTQRAASRTLPATVSTPPGLVSAPASFVPDLDAAMCSTRALPIRRDETQIDRECLACVDVAARSGDPAAPKLIPPVHAVSVSVPGAESVPARHRRRCQSQARLCRLTCRVPCAAYRVPAANGLCTSVSLRSGVLDAVATRDGPISLPWPSTQAKADTPFTPRPSPDSASAPLAYAYAYSYTYTCGLARTHALCPIAVSCIIRPLFLCPSVLLFPSPSRFSTSECPNAMRGCVLAIASALLWRLASGGPLCLRYGCGCGCPSHHRAYPLVLISISLHPSPPCLSHPAAVKRRLLLLLTKMPHGSDSEPEGARWCSLRSLSPRALTLTHVLCWMFSPWRSLGFEIRERIDMTVVGMLDDVSPDGSLCTPCSVLCALRFCVPEPSHLLCISTRPHTASTSPPSPHPPQSQSLSHSTIQHPTLTTRHIQQLINPLPPPPGLINRSRIWHPHRDLRELPVPVPPIHARAAVPLLGTLVLVSGLPLPWAWARPRHHWRGGSQALMSERRTDVEPGSIPSSDSLAPIRPAIASRGICPSAPAARFRLPSSQLPDRMGFCVLGSEAALALACACHAPASSCSSTRHAIAARTLLPSPSSEHQTPNTFFSSRTFPIFSVAVLLRLHLEQDGHALASSSPTPYRSEARRPSVPDTRY